MTQTIAKLHLGRPRLQLKAQLRVAGTIGGTTGIGASLNNGIWSISLNFAALPLTTSVPDPINTYSLIYNVQTGAYELLQIAGANTKVVKTLTGVGALASPYTAQPTDDVLMINQVAGAPFTVTVDWSTRATPLRIVDGKGDANINAITITPKAGQTQLSVVNYSYVINGVGGSIILTPLPDGSGAY